jgi:hypothetical protein
MRPLDLNIQTVRVTRGVLEWHVLVWEGGAHLYLYPGLLLCVPCLSVSMSLSGTYFLSTRQQACCASRVVARGMARAFGSWFLTS